MRRIPILLLIVAAAASSAAGGGDSLRTAADLSEAVYGQRLSDRPFDLTGRLTYIRMISSNDTVVVLLEDDSGGAVLRLPDMAAIGSCKPGDRVRATGRTGLSDYGHGAAFSSALELLARGSEPVPRTTDPGTIASGAVDFRLATFTGTVRDAFPSRTSVHWSILVVSGGGETVNVSLTHRGRSSDFTTALIGARIRLTGVAVPQDDGLRYRGGRLFKCSSPDAIRILKAPDDPFDVPGVETISNLRPSEIARLDRHGIRGSVIAVWGRGRVMVRTATGEFADIDFADDDVPSFGERIEAIGFPESDLYRINLTRARWRRTSPTRDAPEPASDLSARELLTDGSGRTRIEIAAHGRAIRLRGIVRSVPGTDSDGGVFHIADGDFLVPVDVSANRGILGRIQIGARVSVAGTCAMDVENWRPNAVFPRVNGFTVVPRTPEDVRVISSPPWWTPARFAAALSVLLALLAVFFVWNRILNRIVNRRSRELLKEQIAHIGADLRVDERTRLAVELHDSIAQNLTGVAMEIETAGQLAGDGNQELRQHLELSARSLASCRAELRNCLWDLRNRALEETDLDKAIEWTLLPHTKGVKLDIDFRVPRNLLSDKTLHCILSVIRELTVNGVRHGKARTVTVRGSLENRNLAFSVADDGTGFDPDAAPGVLQGHFGLQGVRERLRQHDGVLTIDSRPGRGTTVSITLSQIHEPSA